MTDEKKISEEEMYGTFISKSGNEYETGTMTIEEFSAAYPELAQSENDSIEDPSFPGTRVFFEIAGKYGSYENSVISRDKKAADPRHSYNGVGIIGPESAGYYGFGYINNVDRVQVDEYDGCTYSYIIWVRGGGPKGYNPSTLHMLFTDETNDEYRLYLYKHSPRWHYVRFNSAKPSIKRVSWRFS